MSLRTAEALLRAILVAVIFVAPMVILAADPACGPLVAFLAVGGALLTFVEYVTPVPSVVSFCAAPPYNRMRFSAVAAMFLGGSLLQLLPLQPHMAETARVIEAIATADLSPAQFLIWAVPNPNDVPTVAVLALWGVCVAVLLCTTFQILADRWNWPDFGDGFAQFPNLPRLADGSPRTAESFQGSARIYLLLGLLAPLLGAVVIWAVPPLSASLGPAHPMLTIWIVSAWSLTPAFLVLRALALWRIASVLNAQADPSEPAPQP